ncbi:MAG: BRCT domain-containing protein, partial [Planctomycetaceae bacterium]
PILVGDYVATPLWQGGRRLEAVVVGFVDMDGDSRDDRDRLEKLIRMAGGNVSESVGDSTTLIVDGSGGARAEGRQGGRVKIDDDVMKRRTDQLSRARAKNIARTSVEEIRYWLGDLPQQPSTSSESFAVPTLPPQPSAVGR